MVLVGFGASMPELVTSLSAVLKGPSGIAIGNVVGSKIFNILGIIGVTAVVMPITAPPKVLTYDLWILVAVTALLLYFAFAEARLSRCEGALFLGLYVAYLSFLTFRALGAV